MQVNCINPLVSFGRALTTKEQAEFEKEVNKAKKMTYGITNGEIDNCKVIYSRIYDKGTIEVKDKELRWEPGTFTTKFLTDGFTEFEVEEIENVEEIEKIEKLNLKKMYVGEKINAIETKVNEVIDNLNGINELFINFLK